MGICTRWKINKDGEMYCPGCERYLPMDMFYKNSSMPHGKTGYCMLCHRYAIAKNIGRTDFSFQEATKGRKTMLWTYLERLEELGYRPVVPKFM